jgi:formylglycine-generating enzyme required for sulfatase activity/serine/threonine protein kinase
MGATVAIHPNDEVLQSYGLGKLDDVSSESVSRHLEGCDSCQRRVAELSSDEFLGRLRKAQVTPDKAAPGWSPSVSSTEGASRPVAQPPPVDTLPPELVDHPDWEIIRELGRCGMGVVYLAQNKLMGRPEVLKVVGRHLIERPGVVDRFLREIRLAAKLHHANIVTAHSAIRLGDSLVLAMEFVEGLDLAKMVETKGPLPIAHACYFIHQAALGLQHAHERGMVHRDIKPANLIVASEGKKSVVKVLDFGLAKVTSEGQTDSGLTREGQMLGTPAYIAPEQIRNAQSADIRADIYSLGCTFYYLLTGGPPFRGEHLWDLYQAHFSMEAQPLNLVRPEVPVELAALVAKMMAKEPARRFQTPGEAAQALTPFFRKGNVASVGQKPEVSLAGQPEVGQAKAGAGAVPALSETNMAPASRPTAHKALERSKPGWALEGLIDLREQNPLFDAALDTPSTTAARASSRQGRRTSSTSVAKLIRLGPRRLWAAAGVLLLGLVVTLTVVIKVRTPNGVIVLENVPEDAVVEVDGERITVTPAVGETIGIEAQPGKHVVLVKRGNDVFLGESVTVESGKHLRLTVRLESSDVPKPGEKPAPGADSSRGSGTVVIDVGVVPPVKPAGDLPKVAVADSTRAVNKEVRPDAGPAAKTLKPLESIKNSIGMTLNLIPAGEFMMGSSEDDRAANSNEKPQHLVRITRPFYLGVHEVTQAQYEVVMGNNPSYFSPSGGGRDKVVGQSTDQNPVKCASWLDAAEFCNRLSEMDGLKSFYELEAGTALVPDWRGPGYRLPTEAEWEYACRANSKTQYSFGNNEGGLAEYSWYDNNSSDQTHPVARKRPNAFGLFDMHGNVREWCWETYADYEVHSPVVDPQGPSGTGSRVIRGGRWSRDLDNARSAYRYSDWPGRRKLDLGFRVARAQSAEIKEPPRRITPGAPLPIRAGTAQPSGESKSVESLTHGRNPVPSDVKPPVSTNSIGIKLALLPAGEFMMGSPDANAPANDRPEHKVRISMPFYMGVTEVTQSQYQAVMGNNPCYFSPQGEGRDKVAGQPSGEYPVEQVSWFDAVLFCNALSKRERLVLYYRGYGEDVKTPDRTGPGYRLPTEAEWEYACRGGKSGPYSPGPDPLVEYGWFRANANGSTHPVGKKRPNKFGLYDMVANVWEWCSDEYAEEYYKQSPEVDPPGPSGLSTRVVRGGSGWRSPMRASWWSDRGGTVPSDRSLVRGFRVARTQAPIRDGGKR